MRDSAFVYHPRQPAASAQPRCAETMTALHERRCAIDKQPEETWAVFPNPFIDKRAPAELSQCSTVPQIDHLEITNAATAPPVLRHLTSAETPVNGHNCGHLSRPACSHVKQVAKRSGAGNPGLRHIINAPGNFFALALRMRARVNTRPAFSRKSRLRRRAVRFAMGNSRRGFGETSEAIFVSSRGRGWAQCAIATAVE
jgi:hypothetical protein